MKPYEEYLYINKPRTTGKVDAPELLQKYFEEPIESRKFINEISENGYLYWNKARYRQPIKGLSIEESWLLAKEIRKISSITIPVKTDDGKYFTWYRLGYTDEFLRKIDMYAGGNMMTENLKHFENSERQKYVVRGIMEEAIASSQLEGADTSRRYAKKMLAEKIKPRNHSDWMILNDYKILTLIENEYKDRELSLEMLVDVQRLITENTTDDAEKIGRLRSDDDDIVVHYRGKIAHEPPKTEFVVRELSRLIEYANDNEKFVHPVLKAIVLHFWIGYLHPFPDGNGRTARAIFYWFLQRNNYWAFSYLSISAVIKRAPEQYVYSYVFSEQDDLDFTYFYDYNIRRICMAIDEFAGYVGKVVNENKVVSDRLGKKYPGLNFRQSQLVYFLMEDSTRVTTISRHLALSGVSRPTATLDLRELAELGLLQTKKRGREIEFFPTDELKSLFNM